MSDPAASPGPGIPPITGAGQRALAARLRLNAYWSVLGEPEEADRCHLFRVTRAMRWVWRAVSR